MPTFLGLDPIHWMLIGGGLFLLALVAWEWLKRGRGGW